MTIKNKKIYLLGPTASGKTELAKFCFDNFPTEIISVDSAQIYRHFNIGSAKPTKNELFEYPHHLIDILNPDESYSVAKFCKDCKRYEKEIYKNGNYPFFVGGTMMYFNALTNPIDEIPASTKESRKYVSDILINEGLNSLYKKLKEIDPDYAIKINNTDSQRILRAMEVFYLSNKPISSFHKKTKYQSNNLSILKIALLPNDRKILHEHIESRVDKMLNDGLIEEVESILKLFKNLNNTYPLSRCVGFKQVLFYLQNKISKSELRNQIVFATRQLAKRQITWMRKMNGLVTENPFNKKLNIKVADHINNFLSS